MLSRHRDALPSCRVTLLLKAALIVMSTALLDADAILADFGGVLALVVYLTSVDTRRGCLIAVLLSEAVIPALTFSWDAALAALHVTQRRGRAVSI